MKRFIILSTLLLCGYQSQAQGASITFGWNWPTNQAPQESLEFWWSPTLRTVDTNTWTFLMAQNCYTLVPPLPPTNAVFTLWLANGPNWLYVSTDPVGGGNYTNAVNVITNATTFTMNLTNNAFFAIRLKGKGGRASPFSAVAQYSTAEGSTGWVWVR